MEKLTGVMYNWVWQVHWVSKNCLERSDRWQKIKNNNKYTQRTDKNGNTSKMSDTRNFDTDPIPSKYRSSIAKSNTDAWFCLLLVDYDKLQDRDFREI